MKLTKKILCSYESCSHKQEQHKIKDCPRFKSDVDNMIEDLERYGCSEKISEVIAIGLVLELGWKKE